MDNSYLPYAGTGVVCLVLVVKEFLTYLKTKDANGQFQQLCDTVQRQTNVMTDLVVEIRCLVQKQKG